MKNNCRIALIHATRLAIDPVEEAFRAHWPDVEHVSLLDEALSIDRSKTAELTDEISGRILVLARYAQRLGTAGILYTCSAFGEAIERAAKNSSIPILKPNEAMFERAITMGEQVAMIYTFHSSVAGMEQEFRDEAKKRNSSAKIKSVLAEGARRALEQGNADVHNRIIAETAAAIDDADVILLAHFSMNRAADDARAETGIPILSGPETAVEKLKAVVKR